MRVTYDAQADAAYLYFTESTGSARSVPLSDVLPEMIVLDFDSDDRLIGMEVLNASKVLPRDFLERFAD